MRNHFSVILLAVICVGCVHQESTGNVTLQQRAGEMPALRDIIGVTHVNGRYYLADEDFLNEGAEQILALGSRVIKVWFHKPQESYSFNSKWRQMAGPARGWQEHRYLQGQFDWAGPVFC